MILSILSTYQFYDVYSKFRFLLNDILNNITESVVGYTIFVFLLTITSYLAILFNWKLLRKIESTSKSNLLDDIDHTKPLNSGFLYNCYLVFSGLMIGLGIFLILKPIQENYPINEFPKGILAYFVALIIISLGALFANDGIKLKRH